MKKKSICILMITVLVTVFTFSGISYADEKGDLENELGNVTSEKEAVSNRLAEVEKEIKEMQPKVDALDAEVAEANRKIGETEKEISKKEEEMANREDGLNDRLRVMYKNGSVGFLDVLLGSNSISEFISNLDMIQKIYKNDMNVLETLEKEQKELEAIKDRLVAEKSQLDTKKAELEAEKSKLNTLKKELEAKEDQLEAEAAALSKKLESMVDQGSDYVGGGVWTWPAPASGYITSPFGWRIHPVYGTWKYHSGIDIGASSGTNVVAAAPGTVILAQEYGGYGQCIVIDHGGGVTSLYGHMTRGSIRVSVGQKVSAGQVIALVGSTGISSGPHLHFEVRQGGTVVDPMGYLG